MRSREYRFPGEALPITFIVVVYADRSVDLGVQWQGEKEPWMDGERATRKWAATMLWDARASALPIERRFL